MPQNEDAFMNQATPKQNFKAQFMKKLSNTETELKNSVVYKKGM